MSDKTDTKRTLIDATKQLLCERENFTVKDIAERAFTNIAAINYHFGDKNRLVLLALNELLEGFKKAVIDNFNREFPNNEEALENVVHFLLEVYTEYKGAIKYILLFEDPAVETRLVEKFFFDRDFTDAFTRRISEITGDADPNMLFYRLSVMISAFMFPLLIEGKSSSAEDKISLTALQNEENRKAFVKTIMLLFR